MSGYTLEIYGDIFICTEGIEAATKHKCLIIYLYCKNSISAYVNVY